MTSATTFYDTLTLGDGTQLAYAVVLPAGYTPATPAPVLLALPPGPQTRDMVEAGLGLWQRAAQERGWVVVSPIAPGGRLFFQGSEVYLPEFLDYIAATYPPEGGQFHLAGISNGGISAFRIAGQHPELFRSLLVTPGLPRSADDRTALERIAALPVAMFVGELDQGWVAPMQQTAEALRNLGADVTLTIVPGEGHVIQSLDGGDYFTFFEAHRTPDGRP